MTNQTIPLKPIRSIKGLTEHGLIKDTDVPLIKEVIENFSLAITPQMHSVMDLTKPDDPVAMQFVPTAKELNISSIENEDPIGDEPHSPVKGIIHRYPDRCLFTPVHVCPVYCRFCFRREKVGSNTGTLNNDELNAAYSYIREQTGIWEVILTGGDPLILKPKILAAILENLNAIPHVEIIRIHTRVPVVESHRIDSDMIAALKKHRPIYVVLHANHPNEFNDASRKACADLVDAGIPMLSQSVLLKGINDNVEVLSDLMRCFIRNRVKPYYLHQGDLAKGTQHFRTTIDEGQQLMKQMRGNMTGICQPTYILDIPGGHGKVPIGPNYLNEDGEKNHYKVEDYRGNTHAYSLYE